MTEAQKTTIEIQELYWKHDTVQNPVQTAVVVEAGDALLATEHFVITPTGLRVIGEPSFEDCCQFAGGMGKISGVIALAMGDLLNYCEIKYGETYAQVAEAFGFSEKKIPQMMNWKWVSSRVPKLWRDTFSAINESHKPPSYTLCKEAARVQDDDTRRDLLARAAVSGWDSTDVKDFVDNLKLNGKPTPALAAYLARALAPLRAAAEAYPSARAELNKIIQRLERML